MISFLTIGAILIGSVVFGLYIRYAYIKYDQEETKKEELKDLKISVKNAMIYFHDTYCNDFDHTVYETLRIKVNFLTKIIEKKGIEDQIKYYRKLYEKLYETGFRLKQDFMNVQNIIAPLNSLRDELVMETLDYLKENYEE